MNAKKSALFFLILFLSSCASSTKITERNTLAENNKDVYILSLIIRDYLNYRFENPNPSVRANIKNFMKSGFVKDDSLKRIVNNFEILEVKDDEPGDIVYFEFSKSRRTDGIRLTAKQSEALRRKIRTSKSLSEIYDGKILFAYPERFYGIREIIVKK
ncbi:MAG: hypothetical protein RL708_1337 [Bacteroidota bacterium]|jgi:hypothetical protein